MTAKADLPRIAALARTLGERIRDHGEGVWDLLHDWEKAVPPVSPRDEPDDDQEDRVDTRSAEATRDWLEDARAARWFAEYRSLLAQIEAPLRRLHRLHDLATVEDRKHRNDDGTWDPALAQEAAQAGYCASCWRLDQQLVEIETDRHGHRYYRDWCRTCGAFHAEHGVLPTIGLLRIRQRRAWSTADVTAELTKANVKKGRKAS